MKALALAAVILCGFLSMDAGCRRSTAAATGADPTDLLPLDNDISGFLRKGSAAVMTDEGSIFSAIDGAAEKYIQYGFVEGVQQSFSNGAVDIEIRIFSQNSETNAQELYRYFYPPSPEVISSGPLQVVVDYSLAINYNLFYQYGNFYMEVISSEKSDFALNMAKQFYLNIHTKILAERGE